MGLSQLKKTQLGKFIHNKFFRPRWKLDFLEQIKSGEKLLDVGCGNNSPYKYKTMFPHIHYTGIDVSDYNQNYEILADEYIVCQPNEFASEISKWCGHFDMVLSSHNLEHCLYRDATLDAMMGALRPGGLLYIAFPSEASTSFPHRAGTLNYFDDHTHLGEPPKFSDIVKKITDAGFHIIYSTPQYKPILLRIIGYLQESKSLAKGQILTGTWEYYGFESIIWAKKSSQ